MKIKLIIWICVVFLFCTFSISTYAHSGKTDDAGGHWDHENEEYHYHHGYPAHQHTNGECPYDFDDQTDHSAGTSSGNSNTYDDFTPPTNTAIPDFSMYDTKGTYSTIVYIGEDMFHRKECPIIARRLDMTTKELIEAYALGKTACSICNPPILLNMDLVNYNKFQKASTEGEANEIVTRSKGIIHRNSCIEVDIKSYSKISLKEVSDADVACKFCNPPRYSNPDYHLEGCALGGIGVYAGYLIIKNRKARKEEKDRKEAERIKREQEKLQKEKEQQEKRDAFINSLDGKSLREAANVPQHVVFINGYPRDNNNKTYGSFTMYLSKSGNCYHQKRGCCSANKPEHYLKVYSIYKPCSKCITKQINVPQWVWDYNDLKSKARSLGVSIME